VKLHTKKIKDPKMTKRKLKIPKLQNTKSKNTIFLKTHKMTRKRIENFETSK